VNEEVILEIGQITHFFAKLGVAIIELSAPLSVGDHILVKGPTTDFELTVKSMQIDHQDISRAEGGQSIGLKLPSIAKEKDMVYKKL
jgi:GTPase